MMDRLVANIHDLMIFSGVAFVFGLIKISMAKDPMPVKYHLLTLVLSVLVGTLAGEVALEAGFKDFVALAVTSIGSLLSRDIIAAVINKTFLADLAKRAAENIVDKTTRF